MVTFNRKSKNVSTSHLLNELVMESEGDTNGIE